jgi:glyoxylase-like metal-dependent hydrolase (beta-lactamase superfamily II)
MDDMLESLTRVVLPLDDTTVVLSGHGPQTTIGQERATNPYLRQVAAGQGAAEQAPRRGM